MKISVVLWSAAIFCFLAFAFSLNEWLGMFIILTLVASFWTGIMDIFKGPETIQNKVPDENKKNHDDVA